MKLPSRIDRYQIRERLGQGGMGMLFLALDPAIDRLVALKVLRVDNPDVRERFEREARLAARLQHPNIVTVYDVGEHEGQPFIAMEYIPGETLGELIRRRAPLDLRQKLEMLIELCSGLAFAHKHGIIHRDIKPANLIVSRDSAILKILDFGIARAGESGLTQVGMVVGTPNYMSPEQIRGDVLDHRSDIFAVGLVLYELLAYRQAFEAETQPAVLMKILTEEPTPITRTDPTIDPAVVKILMRALVKNPAERYQDLGAMKTDVVRLLQRLEVEPEDGRTIIVPPPSGRTGPISAARPVSGQTPADGGRAGRVMRHLTGAEQMIAAGNPDAARAELALAAEADPDHPRLKDVRARLQTALDARELARSLGEARRHLGAGAVTEAGRWLAEARRLNPRAAEVAALHAALERALDERERNRERHRRAAAALGHAREAFQAGHVDAAARAIQEALAHRPEDPEARALHEQIGRALAERAAPREGRAPADSRPRPAAVATPPPGPGTGGQPRPPSGAQQTIPQPPPPPPPMAVPPALLSDDTLEARPARPSPAKLLSVVALAAVVLALAVLVAWTRFGARASSPQTPTTADQRPQPSVPGQAPPGGSPEGRQPATPPAAAPPAPGPTAAPSEDAALTARLAQAVAEFQAGRTMPALRTLADLLDEAPQRDDLRLTAEQWASTLQDRMLEVRRSVPKPALGQLPAAMRQADQPARAARAALDGGDPLSAARGFEQARLAWAALAARQPRRDAVPPARPAPAPEPVVTATTPREEAPAPAGPVEAAPAAEPAETAPAATAQDFERASIIRVLQSFERAFEARSAESLKPIWPGLSQGQQQNFQSQFGRVLHQQWTFNAVRIGIDPGGTRAAAICQVSITSLAPGARDTKSEARPVTFKFEKVGPLWVISAIAGL